MDKSTDNLLNEIKSTKDIDKYLRVNKKSIKNTHFIDFLNRLVEQKNISRSVLIEKSNISKQYVYEIFSKKPKKPSRDTVIKLCFGLSLDLEESNRLLKMSGYSELYPKIKRESVIIYCILNDMNIMDTNVLLEEKNVELLI